MPNRDWLYHYPVGIGLIVAFAFCVFSYNQYQKPYHGYCGTPEQCYHAQTAPKGVPSGVGKGVAAGTEAQSPITDPKTYREEQRAEGDLEAQRKMAEWAFWMFFFTGIGTITTGIGIVYLARTLSLSRHTAQRQLRAYVSIESAEVKLLGMSDRLEFRIVFKNFGQTPAYDFSPQIKSSAHEIGETAVLQDIDPPTMRRFRVVVGPGGRFTFIEKLKIERQKVQEFLDSRVVALAYGQVDYRDTFGHWHVCYVRGRAQREGTDWVFQPEREGNDCT